VCVQYTKMEEQRTASGSSLGRRRSSAVAECKHVLVLDVLQSVLINGNKV